jgi:hypothetical protein
MFGVIALLADQVVILISGSGRIGKGVPITYGKVRPR